MNSNVNNIETPKKNRVFELDVLRGIAVIAMMIDHFTMMAYFSEGYNGWAPYVFSNFAEVDSPLLNSFLSLCEDFQNSTFRLVGHYIFATLFLTLCGISCSFSRNNFKRGLKVLIAGLIVTVVTSIISIISGEEDLYILFGILSTLAVSILMVAVVQRYYDNIWLYLGIGIALVIGGFLIHWWDVPRINSIKNIGFVEIIEIIIGTKLFGSDCFGLLPCAGVVFIGMFIGKTVYKERKSIIPKLDGKWKIPFTFVGNNALFFYLLHQVASIVIIALLYLISGYRF